MIDALISGKLHESPIQRTSRNGNAFSTCKVRVAMKSDETVWINVICFASEAQASLQALDAGDSVALSGELTVSTYEARDGSVRPSLNLTAHAVLTTYHVQRRRKVVQGRTANTAGESGFHDDEVPE